MPEELYTQGGYLAHNPTWDVQDSPWKAGQILRMLAKNRVEPTTVCEVGCGAGEILAQLRDRMDPECRFSGYEISPQAFELSRQREGERLHFTLGDFTEESNDTFDLILAIDLIEHLEDYIGFLRSVRTRACHLILHIPLDMSVQMVLRVKPILQGREMVGHIHYFSKETALASVRDAGYEVVDHFYTPTMVELEKGRRSKLARYPRKLAFALNEDLAVRVLGGYGLMVLARPAP
jgi:cyclopropane fatty-acyl-phospholipid synthase-like methyltransferase